MVNDALKREFLLYVLRNQYKMGVAMAEKRSPGYGESCSNQTVLTTVAIASSSMGKVEER